MGIALERRKQGSQVRSTAALENRSYSSGGETSVAVVEMPVSHAKRYVTLRRRAREGWRTKRHISDSPRHAATALDYAYARQLLAATVAKAWYLAWEARQQLALAEQGTSSVPIARNAASKDFGIPFDEDRKKCA